MNAIPASVKEHISNARYYLEAADKFPPPTRNAVHILLLLIAHENIEQAKEELSSWAQKTSPNEKLYKSHAYKFKKVRPIQQIILGERGTTPKTNTYSSVADFQRVLSICRYGPKTGSKSLELIFCRGWFTDEFRNSLISKIKWEEMMVGIYEKLPGYPE
jgi:hypothetical protein